MPIFHTVFAHVYHYAISELCKGLYHHAIGSDTSPHVVGSLRSAICLLAADVLTMGGQGGGPRRAVRRLIDT